MTIDITSYFLIGAFFAIFSASCVYLRFGYVRRYRVRRSVFYNPVTSGILMFLSVFMVLFWLFVLPFIVLVFLIYFLISTNKGYRQS